jgi:hypothetical protein
MSLIRERPTTRLAIAALLVSSLMPVLAQEITAAERAACRTDYDKYCKGTILGGGRIIHRLASDYKNLGSACKRLLMLTRNDAQRAAPK